MSKSILSVDSTLSSNAIGRPKRVVVIWKHSRSPNDDESDRDKSNNLIWYCKHCINYHCASTTTARSHLLLKHDIRIEKSRQLVISKEKAMSNISGPSDVSSVERINEAFLQLVIRHDLPFRAVEWPKMHTLLAIRYPEIGKGILSSHSSISKKINSMWLSAKDDLRIRL